MTESQAPAPMVDTDFTSALGETLALEREVSQGGRQLAEARRRVYVVTCCAIAGCFLVYWVIAFLGEVTRYNSSFHLLFVVAYLLLAASAWRSEKLHSWQQITAVFLLVPILTLLTWFNGILPLTHLSAYIVFCYVASIQRYARAGSAAALLLAAIFMADSVDRDLLLVERLIMAGLITVLMMELLIQGVSHAFSRLRDAAQRLDRIAARLEEDSRVREMTLAVANETRVEKAAADVEQQAMSKFINNLSHRLHTPLDTIVAINQVLSKEPLDAWQHNHVATSGVAAQYLLDLINQALEFSLLRTGKLNLHEEIFELGDMLHSVAATLAVSIRNKPVELQLVLDSDLPQQVLGDKLRLRQVLLNLVSNASRFTREGRITLVLDVVERHDPRVVLKFSVQDSGAGISESEQKRIFQQSVSTDTAATRTYADGRRGLPISAQIVAAMGGQLQLSSEVGSGSCFYFVLELRVPVQQPDPVVCGADATLAAKSIVESDNPPPTTSQPLTGLRILVVDDNEVNQLVASEMLKHQGAEVEAVADGLQALKRVESANRPIDLVLMDVQMPVLDGLEATRLIRKMDHCADLPIIAMTANAMPEDRQISLEAGMNDHITKPVEATKLVDTVLRHSRRDVAGH